LRGVAVVEAGEQVVTDGHLRVAPGKAVVIKGEPGTRPAASGSGRGPFP
jgi:hypothetical protein